MPTSFYLLVFHLSRIALTNSADSNLIYIDDEISTFHHINEGAQFDPSLVGSSDGELISFEQSPQDLFPEIDELRASELLYVPNDDNSDVINDGIDQDLGPITHDDLNPGSSLVDSQIFDNPGILAANEECPSPLSRSRKRRKRDGQCTNITPTSSSPLDSPRLPKLESIMEVDPEARKRKWCAFTAPWSGFGNIPLCEIESGGRGVLLMEEKLKADGVEGEMPISGFSFVAYGILCEWLLLCLLFLFAVCDLNHYTA